MHILQIPELGNRLHGAPFRLWLRNIYPFRTWVLAGRRDARKMVRCYRDTTGPSHRLPTTSFKRGLNTAKEHGSAVPVAGFAVELDLLQTFVPILIDHPLRLSHPMKRFLRILALFLALGLVGTQFSGCLFVVAGAAGGTVAYVKGALIMNVDGSVERVGKASVSAVDDLKFVLVSKRVDAVSGEIIARTAQDTKVHILLKKLTDKSTQVDIRVGTFGDRMISQQVLDAIRNHL